MCRSHVINRDILQFVPPSFNFFFWYSREVGLPWDYLGVMLGYWIGQSCSEKSLENRCTAYVLWQNNSFKNAWNDKNNF